MVPGFNPKEWDRDKIIEWVMDDGPMTDQQIEFLLYFGNLQNENRQLKAELQEANDSIVWWENRFNAVTLKYNRLKARLENEEIHKTSDNNIEA